MLNNNPYVSKKPDINGHIDYTEAENTIWAELYARQRAIVERYACPEYITGLDALALPHDRIPQLTEVSASLYKQTGWGVAAVPALISFDRFFNLLANRQFPAATFIRRREHLDYLQEPDIFHEIYGHCPLLTHPTYANFMEAFGKIGVAATQQERVSLARLFWFTVEFGLIKTDNNIQCYGAGLLSSRGETCYSIDSEAPSRLPFSIIDALRTPYRYDIFQSVYFVIDDFAQLYQLTQEDLIGHIKTSQELGEYLPTFQPKEETSIWNNC
jgi:phenylalanine-4-hydroxylase